MPENFSEVDIVRKGLQTMADQDSGEDAEGVTAIAIVAGRAPRNPGDSQGGFFQVDIDDGVTGGTFSISLNGEETDAIAWSADNTVLGDRILAAINALPSGVGVVFD